MTVEYFERETLLPAVASRLRSVGIILDIGPGIHPQQFVRAETYIWCEPYEEYADYLRLHVGNASNVVLVQATAQDFLPSVADKSIDTVFLVDVLEHLDFDDGRRLLNECERVARAQIVVFTPLGFMAQEYQAGNVDGWGFHGGEWQTHRSGWTPDDFDSSWDFLVCEDYHEANGKGEVFEERFGAFWAIKEAGPGTPPTRKLAILTGSAPPASGMDASVLEFLLPPLASHAYYLIAHGDEGRYGSEFLFGRPPMRTLPCLQRGLRVNSLPENYLTASYSDEIAALILHVFDKMSTMSTLPISDVIQLAAGWLAEKQSLVPVVELLAGAVYRIVTVYPQMNNLPEPATIQTINELYQVLSRLSKIHRQTNAAVTDALKALQKSLDTLHEQAERLNLLTINLGLICAPLLEMHSRAAQILSLLENDPAGALLVVVSDKLDLPAAFLASRWANLPLVCCLLEDYAQMWGDEEQTIGRPLENAILPHCRAIWVADEALRLQYVGRQATMPITYYRHLLLPDALAEILTP